MGYCIVQDIDIYIENLFGSCISIKSLREQILRQTNLLGPLTRFVDKDTRVLTYVGLMLISISHGLPMYVTLGWDKVLEEWYNIVNENSVKQYKPQTANKTCVWLARYVDSGIVLNKPILYSLFVRLMNKAFTPDKKIVKGDNGEGYIKYLKKHYADMVKDGSVGNGRVKPVEVYGIWNPYEKRFKPKRSTQASNVVGRINTYEPPRKTKLFENDLQYYETQIKEIKSSIDALNKRD